MTEPDADDTEAAWREIVANYGDRALVDPAEYADIPAEPEDLDDPDDLDGLDGFDGPDDLDDTGEPGWDDVIELDDEERFVPPPPPPLPRARPDRMAAWVGVLGSPVVVLVLLLTSIRVPTIVGWVLVAAFVGGFGYLVATMSREPRDPWDDGSRI